MNTTRDERDSNYDDGWHDGVDHGYRFAQTELTCPHCGRRYTDTPPVHT